MARFESFLGAALLALLTAGAMLLAVMPPRGDAPAAITAGAQGSPSTLVGFLAQVSDLDLSAEQQQRIAEIVTLEEPWVRKLEDALADARETLGRAELACPFDEALVSDLIGREAELASHLRGVESRLVSRIANVLTAEQRERFEQRRHASAPGPRAAAGG
jgi:Spy/CpxP family protein refolding chaperone